MLSNIVKNRFKSHGIEIVTHSTFKVMTSGLFNVNVIPTVLTQIDHTVIVKQQILSFYAQ